MSRRAAREVIPAPPEGQVTIIPPTAKAAYDILASAISRSQYELDERGPFRSKSAVSEAVKLLQYLEGSALFAHERPKYRAMLEDAGIDPDKIPPRVE